MENAVGNDMETAVEDEMVIDMENGTLNPKP